MLTTFYSNFLFLQSFQLAWMHSKRSCTIYDFSLFTFKLVIWKKGLSEIKLKCRLRCIDINANPCINLPRVSISVHILSYTLPPSPISSLFVKDISETFIVYLKGPDCTLKFKWHSMQRWQYPIHNGTLETLIRSLMWEILSVL